MMMKITSIRKNETFPNSNNVTNNMEEDIHQNMMMKTFKQQQYYKNTILPKNVMTKLWQLYVMTKMYNFSYIIELP